VCRINGSALLCAVAVDSCECNYIMAVIGGKICMVNAFPLVTMDSPSVIALNAVT